MNILTTETYKEITAADGKLIKDMADNTVCRKVIFPVTISEDEINSRFMEIDADNFIIKDGQKYSKLAIRRACRELGIEYKLNGILNTNSLFAADWHDATEIDLSDPVLLEALAGGAFTAQEITDLKNLMG